ncbi:MAG: LysR family transcriptional regulator [Firmicutes bacterium]|nr:LysR family transcriptional regulator [Bacillota bacterium]
MLGKEFLGVSQLEEELGVTLFHRGTRKITLTNEGILLRRRAEEILALVDKTEQELIEQEENIEGTVTIGCGDLAAVQRLPGLIQAFRQKYPAVQFDIFTATADYVKESMERGLIDVGLLLEPIDMEKFEFIRLRHKERWVVSMRPDSPLAQKDAVTAEDLRELPLLLPRRLNVRSELASWFGDSFEKLNVVCTGNLPSNSSVLVHHGLVYGVGIEGSLSFWDKEKLVCRPLSPELMATSVFAWKRQQPFAPAAARFIQHIKRAYRDETDQTR